MSERVSVIIPVYKAERTLERCLDSVLAQTHTDLEVVCVVDGGGCVDGSADILSRYAARDTRVKVLDRESDGPATARNAGLEAATGRYIGFVDADDYIEPEMYEQMLGLLKDSGAEIASCGHLSFFPDGTEKTARVQIDGVFDVRDTNGLGRLITETPDFIWDKLFDARIIHEEELCFPQGRVYGEDTVFLVKYLGHVKKAIFTAAPYYHYNAFSDGSITNTMSDRWYDIFENLKDILFYFRERLCDSDFAVLKPCLEALCIRYYDRRANAMFRYGEKGFQIRYVKYSFEFLTMNFPDWKARMRALPGIAFPRIKTSLFLMRLYILAPGFLKRGYADRLPK